MAEPLTEALAESTRAAAKADELERDRIAWNLPSGKVGGNAPRPEHSDPAARSSPDPGEPRR